MKRIALALTFALSVPTMMACSGTPNDSLTGTTAQQSVDPSSLAGGQANTQHHFKDPNSGDNGLLSPEEIHAQDQQVGTPVEVARYHSCAKVTFASLGSILSTRGVNGAAMPAPSSFAIYKAGAAALGVANYSGRVPEALTASTSAMAKQFDIFIAAAPDIQKNLTTSTACPGVTIADATGKFSKDGLSCLMGKLATDAHVTVANQAVADAVKGGATQDQGIQIALAAALEASHTCE
jgi:hypothetical protein